MNLEDGKVFRIRVSGGNNHLALLIGVLSDDPLFTLQNYMNHAAVVVESDPVEVTTLNPASKGIDLVIRSRTDGPGYAIVNLKKLDPIDLTLKGPA